MAINAKKGNGYVQKEQKALGYSIGEKFDLYKMTGMKKPEKKKDDKRKET